MDAIKKTPKVGLFVTCLVDMFRPVVGFASIQLLEEAGCLVDVPETQTCCGQPAFNAGDRETTRKIAISVIETFEPYDYVVVPSGSCGGMLKAHYGELFEGDDEWQKKAQAFSDKTFELMIFLVDVLGIKTVQVAYEGSVTYHDSCAGLRELGIEKQPRQLLGTVDGLELHEMKEADVCCGFGGLFCVKYSDISNAIVSKKVEHIAASGADTVLAGDLGCLMNIAGKLTRDSHSIKARHVAEILANMVDGPAIGENATGKVSMGEEE